MGIRVTSAALTPASEQDARAGLLGWITCVVNDELLVDGLALRRTADDRLALSFPIRRDGAGRRHSIIRPISDEARVEIEAQIFDALNIDEAKAAP